jgi:hypothetical protein
MVFINVCHGNSDHKLMAVTLQLHLQVLPRAMASSGVWDATAFRDKPHATINFCCLLRNRFALLSLDLLDPHVEWFTLEHEIFEATG